MDQPKGEKKEVCDIKQDVQKEIDRLEKALQEMESALEQAPKGYLKIRKKKGHDFYYHRYKDEDNNKSLEQYIEKRNEGLIKKLAQKSYYTKMKPFLQKELTTLQFYRDNYNPEKADEMFDSLPPERKNLIVPVRMTPGERIRRWNCEQYEPCKKHPENLIFETEKGEMVRSKSEVIIANLLNQNEKDLLYKYERPLELKNGREIFVVHPDFTILNIHTGKITYWEHAGRMDDFKYLNKHIQKMYLYEVNQLFTGEHVIVTYETTNSPLNIQSVKRYIQRLI